MQHIGQLGLARRVSLRLDGVAVARLADLPHVGLQALRQPHDVRLVAQRAQHEGAHVPRGVGREAHAA